MELNRGESYLIGLLLGRGFINLDVLTIEFHFANEYVSGVALCPLCNSQATKPRDQALQNSNFLRCKDSECINSTKTTIDPNVKKNYHQPTEFHNSIKEKIIPFLSEYLEFKYTLLSSSTCLFLSISPNKEVLDKITSLLEPHHNFTNFTIPKEFNNSSRENKIELINGLLDSCGFANAGNYFNTGRQRVYFQITNRNYKLPIDIDNFLREHFFIPIQTIRWAHPNITDPNLKDYLKGKASAHTRENQLKIFIEYMKIFKFRISSKKYLFDEMLNSTKNLGFEASTDTFPSPVARKIKLEKVKAKHPEERNIKVNESVRGHFDAYWQISLRMGCKFLTKQLEGSFHKELFKITGIEKEIDNPEEIINQYKRQSEMMFDKIILNENKVDDIHSQGDKNANKNLESDTYKPLMSWLGIHCKKNYRESYDVFDSSNVTLNNFILNNEKLKQKKINLDFDSLNIRPDVVGFLNESAEFIFIESKIVPLGLKELGQLIGYCELANPKEAFLISTKGLNQALSRVLIQNTGILNYGEERKIKIGKLVDSQVKLMQF